MGALGKDPSEAAGGSLCSKPREAGRDTEAERRHTNAGYSDGTGLQILGRLKSWLPFKETAIRTLGWIFIAGAFAAFAYSIRTEPLKDAILPAGVLIALSGAFFSQARDSADSRQKTSGFYLESAIKAFQEAQDLLKDGNNDRATWIAAGRALEHAKRLSAGVTIKAHRYVLELNSLRYRKFFGELLRSKDAKFFYGIRTMLEDMSLNEAAELSTKGEGLSALRMLSEESIHAVWEAAQWPEKYQDPLGRKFTNQEVEELMLFYKNLHEFLEHKKRKQAFHAFKQ